MLSLQLCFGFMVPSGLKEWKRRIKIDCHLLSRVAS